MLKPSPRGQRCNPDFRTYQVDNPLTSVKAVWCLEGQKTWLITAPADQVSTARLYSNNHRGSCPDLIALDGHLWAKVMLCVLALAVMLEPCADTCFSSHSCRETALFSPSSVPHLGAGPHNADGLFQFPRWSRQNP